MFEVAFFEINLNGSYWEYSRSPFQGLALNWQIRNVGHDVIMRSFAAGDVTKSWPLDVRRLPHLRRPLTSRPGTKWPFKRWVTYPWRESQNGGGPSVFPKWRWRFFSAAAGQRPFPFAPQHISLSILPFSATNWVGPDIGFQILQGSFWLELIPLGPRWRRSCSTWRSQQLTYVN